jgi:lipopolysaccharide O-acetyltransferase
MVRLDAFGGENSIWFGENVELNDFVHIGSLGSITIGDNVMIASRVLITDHGHGIYTGDGSHSNPTVAPSARKEVSVPVVIERNVWIGEGVSILPGTHIGEGSLIGAGSVVKGNIPPFCLAVGVPAKVIKCFDAVLGRWVPVGCK